MTLAKDILASAILDLQHHVTNRQPALAPLRPTDYSNQGTSSQEPQAQHRPGLVRASAIEEESAAKRPKKEAMRFEPKWQQEDEEVNGERKLRRASVSGCAAEQACMTNESNNDSN